MIDFVRDIAGLVPSWVWFLLSAICVGWLCVLMWSWRNYDGKL